MSATNLPPIPGHYDDQGRAVNPSAPDNGAPTVNWKETAEFREREMERLARDLAAEREYAEREHGRAEEWTMACIAESGLEIPACGMTGPEIVRELRWQRDTARAEADRLTEALRKIADHGTDMPAAYNDEVGWYRGLAWDARGIAAAALAAHRETPP